MVIISDKTCSIGDREGIRGTARKIPVVKGNRHLDKRGVWVVGHQTARIFRNWSSNTNYFNFDDQTPLRKHMFGHQTARIFRNWSSNTKFFNFDDQTPLLKYMVGHQTARIFRN